MEPSLRPVRAGDDRATLAHAASGSNAGYGARGTANAQSRSPDHEDYTRTAIARQIAALLGYGHAGEYDAGRGHKAPHCYFVPSDTLTCAHAERDLGIASENDLFGAVVPYPYVATKVITHPLCGREACALPGWSHAFHDGVRAAVLPGYAAFTRSDARKAAATLLVNWLTEMVAGARAGADAAPE